ncbi:MAG TPA: DUF92 domain-containing protein [Thermoanaerobaculia bacterium]|jgi:uncharacterized protein (TIGR00297 family)|nr:DUF92 domain-containing protein [Thermoanaerobaculia bacterium]
MSHQPNETLRQSLHIAFGLFAFALKWLPWWLAAIVAACAIVGNFIVLHRIVGPGVARHVRGWDAGIVLYPMAVLALILVFRHHLQIGAAAWVILAFGDGFATLIGRRARIASLPWNRDKSWGGLLAFVIAACAAGAAIAIWMGGLELTDVLAAVIVGAIVESLPLRVDDNVTVPFGAAVTLTLLSIPFVGYLVWPRTKVWLVIHTALALAGWLLRTVDLSGFIGGWILGAIILLGAGWPLYVTLLTFFVIGTLATKIGFARKKRLGLAQEKEGRRGFVHAFSNVGVAAICAIAVTRLAGHPLAIVALFMAIASLATAAADTAASEIGPLVGRRTFLPLSGRPVEPGTEGAISLEGTLVGLLAGTIVAMVGTTAASMLWPIPFRTRVIILVTLCALVGSYLESIAGSWNRRAGSPVPNGVLNFFNTVAGALLLYFTWPLTA